jgi:nitrite reductase/ring-hydroxylating ferredoxin subunit
VFLAPGGNLIRCIMHGALFEIDTGDCVAGPCLGDGLQSLPIHLRDGYVVLDDGVPLQDPN